MIRETNYPIPHPIDYPKFEPSPCITRMIYEYPQEIQDHLNGIVTVPMKKSGYIMNANAGAKHRRKAQ